MGVMNNSSDQREAVDRRREFIEQLCQCAELPILMMAFFDSTSRVFTKTWMVQDPDCQSEKAHDIEHSAESRMAVFAAIQSGDSLASTDNRKSEKPAEYPIWMRAGHYVIGVGKPVAGIYPVLVCPSGVPNIKTEQQALLRIGLAYAHQQLTEDVYSKAVWPEGLVEATMKVLSIEFILVDEAGVVQFDGRHNQEPNENEPQWQVMHGRLTLEVKKERDLLKEAIGEATSLTPNASIISVSTSSGLVRLAAVAPLAASEPRQAMILFEAQRTDHAALREHFFNAHGLTQSERLIAHEVLDGKTLNDAAEITGLSLATVRSYMKQIFTKTGAHRQSELISLYYTSILPVGTTIAKAESQSKH